MSNKRFDLLALGECLVEFRRTGDGLLMQSFAGDTFNSLFYASRLRLSTSYLSAIANDEYSSGIIDLMDGEHIHRGHLITRSTRPNGAYLIEIDKNQIPTFTFWRKRSAATTLLESYSLQRLAKRIQESSYLLISMIAVGILHKRERLIEALRLLSDDTTIILDLNYRASIWKNRENYLNVLSEIPQADYVMYSSSDGDIPVEYLSRLNANAVIKRNGEAPTMVVEGNDIYTIPTYPARYVLDTTGAGDAFNAGFIYGLNNNFDVASAVAFGNICGREATQGVGGIYKGFSMREILRTFRKSTSSY